MAGYSGTALSKKLGLKAGFRLYFRNAPDGYLKLLEPLPDDSTILKKAGDEIDLIQFFTKSKTELELQLESLSGRIRQNGMIWVSWPKKASKVKTDVTEDVVRDLALTIGMVDVKVCAVDDVWSGLKLVIRKENRRQEKP